MNLPSSFGFPTCTNIMGPNGTKYLKFGQDFPKNNSVSVVTPEHLRCTNRTIHSVGPKNRKTPNMLFQHLTNLYEEAFKRKISCVTICLDLMSIMLSETNQTEGDKYHDFTYMRI